MSDKIKITRKLQGEDGSRILSIRIRNDLLEKLDKLAEASNRSRNDIITILLTDGVARAEVSE